MDGDNLLADRRRNFLAVDDNEVVRATAIVSVKHQETGLTMTIPCDISCRILHEHVEIIGMIVGPIHGDDELGL